VSHNEIPSKLLLVSESQIIELNPENRRKYPRVKVPKGTFASWKSADTSVFARVDTIGLGGVYLNTLKPLAKGSTTDLVLGLSTGKVCIRATVRRSLPGRGMGLEFVQMAAEDRARLNQFLLQQDAPHKVSAVPRVSNSQSATSVAEEPTGPVPFERELKHLIEVAEKGTYYQLLAVTPESPSKDIKKSYYAFARKFHPDLHMDKSEFIGPLKELMAVVTVAYNTLKDEQKRANYDRVLAASGAFNLQRGKTESQETVEECLKRANECLRAKNFIGSVVWLRKCVHREPDRAKYHAMLARSLATVVAYRDESIEHFQKAIDLDPWNTTAYFQFGQLYEEMQLPWRARTLYLKILEINPVHTKARERLEQLDAEERSGNSPSIISRVFGKKN
jgi:tetratricopeptide (TPR) repeat protein